MVQVKVANSIMKEVIKVADNHPIYKSLDLANNKAYVDEILKDFIKLNGEIAKQTFKEELEKVLIENHLKSKENEKSIVSVEKK